MSATFDTLQHGDCIKLMRRLPDESVDMILTDPPYLVRYRDRSGRPVPPSRWLKRPVHDGATFGEPGQGRFSWKPEAVEGPRFQAVLPRTRLFGGLLPEQAAAFGCEENTPGTASCCKSAIADAGKNGKAPDV